MAERVTQITSHLTYPKGLLGGQTAIITGSGQGIGAEAARLFAREGANVVVCDVDAGMSPRKALLRSHLKHIVLTTFLSTRKSKGSCR